MLKEQTRSKQYETKNERNEMNKIQIKNSKKKAGWHGHRILFYPFLIYDYYVWLQGATEAVNVKA